MTVYILFEDGEVLSIYEYVSDAEYALQALEVNNPHRSYYVESYGVID